MNKVENCSENNINFSSKQGSGGQPRRRHPLKEPGEPHVAPGTVKRMQRISCHRLISSLLFPSQRDPPHLHSPCPWEWAGAAAAVQGSGARGRGIAALPGQPAHIAQQKGAT